MGGRRHRGVERQVYRMSTASGFDFISPAIAETGVQACLLETAQRQLVLAQLGKFLGVDVTADAPWDCRAAPDGVYRPDGWKLIAKYVGRRHAYVFTPGAETMWSLTGDDLLQVLSACPPLEFTVCSLACDYLLCFNHHDVLIGWGNAQHWASQLRPYATAI